MFARHLLAIGLFALAVSVTASAASLDKKWLITPGEAVKVRQSTNSLTQSLASVEGPGPRIIVRNPKALERLMSPVDIFVSFQPGKSGKRPDMASLTVTLIGFIDIDITDRVHEYVVGDDLDIADADMPSGSHQIRLAIRDVAGNPNERDMSIYVEEQEEGSNDEEEQEGG